MTRAMALRQAGRLSEAEAVLRQATLAAPRSAEAHHHLGGILAQQGRRTEAEAAWRRTLALAPGAPSTEAALGALLLADGRYAEGFRLFESRHVIARMAKPRLPYPEWRGEDLTGRKLLIWPEQGFGDQIQFARFAPLAAAAGADVTLLCLPPLQRLFAASLGVRVLAASGQVEFPDPDVWVMAGSLAGRMGVTVETVPGAPYLRPVDPPAPAPDGFRVGVMTAGNPAHANDTHRSLPAAMAERLRAGLPGAVVDLRPEATGARDFADSAQVIAGLDLVVAVDTSVAHLAGALGKPVFVLLSAVNTDWRWLRERSDSPWYPSARLYRQAAADDWAPVIDRVLADAHAMAHGSG